MNRRGWGTCLVHQNPNPNELFVAIFKENNKFNEQHLYPYALVGGMVPPIQIRIFTEKSVIRNAAFYTTLDKQVPPPPPPNPGTVCSIIEY